MFVGVFQDVLSDKLPEMKLRTAERETQKGTAFSKLCHKQLPSSQTHTPQIANPQMAPKGDDWQHPKGMHLSANTYKMLPRNVWWHWGSCVTNREQDQWNDNVSSMLPRRPSFRSTDLGTPRESQITPINSKIQKATIKPKYCNFLWTATRAF